MPSYIPNMAGFRKLLANARDKVIIVYFMQKKFEPLYDEMIKKIPTIGFHKVDCKTAKDVC